MPRRRGGGVKPRPYANPGAAPFGELATSHEKISSHARSTLRLDRGSRPELRAGRFVVIVDDEDRENEGDLVLAAEKVTPAGDQLHGPRRARPDLRGLDRASAATPWRSRRWSSRTRRNFGTAFTVSIEARGRTTTGISAADRAATVLAVIDPATTPADLLRPGHMFPLRAQPGGVLKRAGQTEASVDLARIAGLDPSAVICEIMNEDGSMARVPDLAAFCERHGLLMVTVADLIRHRMRNERLVQRIAAPNLPTRYGEFRLHAYRSEVTNEEAVALAHGEIREDEPVLVRVHCQCLTGDVFGSSRLRLRRAARRRDGEDRRGGPRRRASTCSRRGAASG